MKTYQLGVMYGDVKGKEVVEATLEFLKAANKSADPVKIELEVLPMDLTVIDEFGHPLLNKRKKS